MKDVSTLDELIAALQAKRAELPGDTPVRISGSLKQTFHLGVSTGRLAKTSSRLGSRLLVSRGGDPVVLITRD